MADNNIDDEIEQVKKQLSELGIVYDKYINDLRKSGMSYEQANKQAKILAVNLAESAKAYKKSAVDIDAAIKSFKNSIKNGETTAEDLEEELKKLRDQINKTSDQGKKQDLLDAKADLEARNARYQAGKVLNDSVLSMSTALGVGVAKAFSGAAGAALRGGDSFDVAGSMMNAGVDLINTANQGSANALKSFGSSTAGAGGKLGALGVVASVAGEALGAVSNGLSELAKAGIGFMLAQTKQLITGFQTMSASGAVFNGGMISMTNTALSAGMTLDQFSKAVSSNSLNLSRTGLSVSEASRRMAAAMQKGGDTARNGMFALGMGMEEQADAFATTMAIMAGPSGQLKASNAQVAAETQEYAKNLKIISGITGQDAKARIEKVRQENDTLAFNAVLNKMGETERKKTVEAMALMSESDARAFREKKLYNAVISTDLAGTRATNSGIRKAQDEMFAASERHALDVQVVGDAYQRNSAETLKAANAAGASIGLATSGAAVGIGKAMNETAQHAIKFNNAADTAAMIAAEQAKGAAGQGGEAVDLMAQQQEFAERMQEIAVTHLPAFSTALQASYDAAMKAVEALDSMASYVEENPLKALFLSLLAPIASVVASLITLPATIRGMMGKSGPLGPGGTGSTPLGPGGPGSRYEAPKKGIVNRGLNAVKGVVGKAGILGAVIGTGMAAKELYDTEQDKTLTKGQKQEKQGGIVGGGIVGAGGAFAGAKVGAAIGAFGGPVGIAIGGLLGAGIGYYLGQKGGEIVGKAVMKDKSIEKIVKSTTTTTSSGTLKGVTSDQIKSHPNYKKYLAEEESNFPGSSENYASVAERVKADMIKSQGAKIKTPSANKSTAPKPLAGAPTQLTAPKPLAGAPTQLTAPKPLAGAPTQLTAPKPLVSQMSQNLAAEQMKLYGAVADPAADANKAKAMEKPVASANPAEQQQISLLQSILSAMQQNNKYASGLLQNSY